MIMNDTDLREDTNPINEFLITISIMPEQGWINLNLTVAIFRTGLQWATHVVLVGPANASLLFTHE